MVQKRSVLPCQVYASSFFKNFIALACRPMATLVFPHSPSEAVLMYFSSCYLVYLLLSLVFVFSSIVLRLSRNSNGRLILLSVFIFGYTNE